MIKSTNYETLSHNYETQHHNYELLSKDFFMSK